MKYLSGSLITIIALGLIGAFVGPSLVSERTDFNLKFDRPTDAEMDRIKNEALNSLNKPFDKLLLWPGKLVISKQYSLSTYEVNAHTFFGIRFATIQVKCFGECSSFRKSEPGELEIVYNSEKVELDKTLYNTNGWQTYQSSQHYKLRYKSDWTIRTVPRGLTPSIIAEELSVHPKEFDRSGPSYLISINVISGMNFDEFIRDIKTGERIDDPLTPLVFNGKNGYIQDGTYYIYHKDNMYQISFNPDEAYGLSDQDEMAALTSIEFID
jgi:hypothetical protein